MNNIKNLLVTHIQKAFRKYGYKLVPARKQYNYKSELYHRLYPKVSIKNRCFYNIGAGIFYHPFWTNIDHNSEWDRFKEDYFKTNIEFDLLSLKPLPIRSNSAEIVYSSHTVEHITDNAAQNMFNESYRILKRGGYIRLTMPNIDLHYRAYKENDRDYFFWIDYYSKVENFKGIFTKPLNKSSVSDLFLEQFAATVSPILVIGEQKRIISSQLRNLFTKKGYISTLNYCTSLCSLHIQRSHSGNHINWWNKDKAIQMLKRSGFNSIYLSAHQQSYCPVLRDVNFFDSTNPQVSLYIEAVK